MPSASTGIIVAAVICGIAPYWKLAGIVLVVAAQSDAIQARAGDPELIALVAEPYADLDDFLNRLTALEDALAGRGDRRVIFAAIYRVLTTAAREDVEQQVFEDMEWAEALTVTFGNFYRQAFYDYEAGNLARVPPAWRVTFDATRSDSVTVFQHALLGVHAHINRDLAHAIAAVTPPSERGMRFPDYVLTNDLVVGEIESVEALIGEAFAPPLGELDEALNTFDEKLLRVALSRWRHRAWRNAQFFDGRWPPFFEMVFGYLLDARSGRTARALALGDRGIE